jgi:rod shape-determining protein MreB
MVSDILSIGIDLGTSRSVVCASNEQRQWVDSYVGWPKDFIARRTLGNRVLFGADALEHRLSLDLVRPLANGVIREGTARDEEAVRELVGYLIALAGAQPQQQLHVAVGIPAEALKVNRTAIVNAVSAHADRLIIVSEPFAVAYSLAVLDNAMVIDIGAGTVDFCIMHGAMPGEEDQRSLTTAGDYVDQQLYELLTERHPNTDFTLNMARRYKEEYGFVGDARSKVEIEAPVQGKMVKHDITDELRRACESIMPPIVETIMDMIAKFDPEYQEKIRGNIILAGGGSQLLGIEDYLTGATRDFEPCIFTRVEDPLYVGADGALGLAQDAPEEYWEK